MVNSKVVIFIVFVCLCVGGLVLGVRSACTLCRDKAVAECNAATAAHIATAAQTRQGIQTGIKAMAPSDKRKLLQKWVVK